jgi:hypothetical protein
MKKRIISGILAGSLLLLPMGGCSIFKPIVGVVCENQAIADVVKTAAQVILTNARATAEKLQQEISGTTDGAVLALLNPALEAANVVIETAYNLVYNVACPNLDMLTSLETQQTTMQAKASQANAAYQLMVKRNSQK